MNNLVDVRSHSHPGSAHRLRAAAVGICLALTALSGSAFAQQCANVKIEDPIPGLIPPSPIQVNLKTIMSGLISPVGGAVAPGVPNRIFVLDQIGKI